MPETSLSYNLILWGATSSTGVVVARRLLDTYGLGADFRWAIAGRNREKLERLRAELGAPARNLSIEVADAKDVVALTSLAKRTNVVVSTVGPYGLYGRDLVAACAENGTDYCDITGEVPFMRDTIDRHHATAQRTGARIVSACGFDSIPSDLGTWMVQTFAQRTLGQPCDEVKLCVTGMSGHMGGGTAATLIDLFEQASSNSTVRRLLADPYALDPDFPAAKKTARDAFHLQWDEDLAKWTVPFFMGPTDSRVVRRTNALLGYAYGDGFVYNETLGFSRGPTGWSKAVTTAGGLAAFAGAVSIGPLRTLIAKKLLPAPGVGPSEESMNRGFFKIRILGLQTDTQGRKQPKVSGKVQAKGDPGHRATALMLVEAAMFLVRERGERKGGVLTPAACMGQGLIDRLVRAGMTLEVSVSGDAQV